MATSRAPKNKTVTADKAPEDPEVKETKVIAATDEGAANAEMAEEDKSGETKCDNHPHRYGRTFTGGGSYRVNLCDECTPPWFVGTD